MNTDYESQARRADTLRKIAVTQDERDYWHGYRLGMVDADPRADQQAKETRLRGFTGEKLRGYKDGLNWNQ